MKALKRASTKHLHESLASQKNHLSFLENPITAVISITMIVFIVVIMLFLNSLRYSATLELLVAPSSATISINGKEYKNGTNKLEPGEYEITISKEGFTTTVHKVTLEKNKTTNFRTYLIQSDGSFSWYQEHKEDMMLLNTIGDAEAREKSANYANENPIIEKLPIIIAEYDKHYNYTEYRIDGGQFEDCKKTFCLKITDSTGGNKQVALKKIQDLGFNPDDYTIIYEYTPIEELK